MIIKIYVYITLKIHKIVNLKEQQSTNDKKVEHIITDNDFEIYYDLLDENRLATSTEIFFIDHILMQCV